MPEPLDTHATADQILGLHLSRWQDRAREAEARIVEMEAAAKNAEKDIDDYSGYIDRIDAQVSEALKAIGEFPPKPAGMADRIDVACDLLVSLSAAAKPLVWTSEPPKEEGWYWCSGSRFEARNIQYVHEDQLGSGWHRGCHWYGPIPEPKEADDADRA